jgi:hypothetical protein
VNNNSFDNIKMHGRNVKKNFLSIGFMFEYSINKYLMPRFIKEILNLIQKRFSRVVGRFLSVK